MEEKSLPIFIGINELFANRVSLLIKLHVARIIFLYHNLKVIFDNRFYDNLSEFHKNLLTVEAFNSKRYKLFLLFNVKYFVKYTVFYFNLEYFWYINNINDIHAIKMRHTVYWMAFHVSVICVIDAIAHTSINCITRASSSLNSDNQQNRYSISITLPKLSEIAIY